MNLNASPILPVSSEEEATPRFQRETAHSHEPLHHEIPNLAAVDVDSEEGEENTPWSMVKRIASHLPGSWQTELKRHHYGRQISKGRFVTDEPEFAILDSMINPGDWVVDIGANVGHYTKKLSELVGESGRVFAFEPMPTTFSLLASNVQMFQHSNVSLMNAAVSDKLDLVGMAVPKFDTGLDNYYEAQLSKEADPETSTSVLTLSLDSLLIEHPVSLVKIDAEGHEAFVLEGMKALIETHRPVLVLETESDEVIESLKASGYVTEKLPGSPNVIFRPAEVPLPT